MAKISWHSFHFFKCNCNIQECQFSMKGKRDARRGKEDERKGKGDVRRGKEDEKKREIFYIYMNFHIKLVKKKKFD